MGGNNFAQATVVVSSPGVISGFTKTVGGTFIPGGTVTYTVTLTNTGTSAQLDNPGNEFSDVLPATLTLLSATATSGTAVATVGTNTVTWNGSIAAAASVTITISATINAGAIGTIGNQGTVNSDPNGDGINDTVTLTDDPAVGGTNDPTSFTSTSSASISTRTKTVTGSFVPGGAITYTIVITNSAASAQLDNPGDEFTDILPASLVLQSASATSGTSNASLGTNTVTWNGGLAASGGTVTITINALISAGAGGTTVSNQGTIQFDSDGNGTNESSLPTDDPSVGGISDPTAFGVSGVLEIPALDWIGFLALISLLAFGALRALRRSTAK